VSATEAYIYIYIYIYIYTHIHIYIYIIPSIVETDAHNIYEPETSSFCGVDEGFNLLGTPR
jgi:hypothetical protein